MIDTLNSLLAHPKAWIASVFLIILATAVLALATHRLLTAVTARAGKTRSFWDDALVEAAERPLQATVWALGVDLSARLIHRHTGSELFSYADDVRALLVIVFLAWFLLRLVRAAERRATAPDYDGRVDATTASAIGKLLRITVLVTAALTLFEKMGYSISGILAFGGIGGIAVGFAAKDLLANFFGGLMIFLDRPFSIGDWIRSPDREIEGTVEHIGWRQTVIRTFDKRPLYVPNATFAAIAVENPSRMSHRRIHETIGIRYDDWQKMPAIVADVKAMLATHEGIAADQTMIINFDRFNESSLDFFVYVFTRTKDWVEYHAVKQDVLFRIMKIVAAHGAAVALPTRTLHMVQEPPTAN